VGAVGQNARSVGTGGFIKSDAIGIQINEGDISSLATSRMLADTTVGVAGRASATGAAIHRGDEYRGRAAQAGFGDVNFEPGLEGGIGST